MARYEHLPIYKQAFDMAVHFEKVVAGFLRYHKYTLGTQLRGRSRAVVLKIIQANACWDKTPQLLQLRWELEELLLIIRLCKKTQAFKNFKSFQFAAEGVARISRQNEGWIKACNKKKGPEFLKRRTTIMV
ncbi:four helix bundle protein [Desulfobacter latus]|uniref:Four helix bundle protein n=1 Tax=Desulfobacter latus TaxID=2292 RepID=A0A850T835_9BACT|nr:four helix bundle protein [Desulfobacter latus]NWH05295.1 four helix bundle protein [Desulfobacter latus]